MKILWIEDFGGGLAPSKVLIEMFSSFIPVRKFDLEYDADNEDIQGQLSELFKRYTPHKIFLCRSYLEWRETYILQKGDFDIALIDINLEAHITRPGDLPLGVNPRDFDRKAGFHIYHQLIRNGFPDENIAFFTGEHNSLMEFAKYCGEILIDSPKHTFEKKSSDFEKLRGWLTDRASAQHLILRRGIIEGCRFMKTQLSKIGPSDLERRLLFYKTTLINVDYDPELYRTEVFDYLTKLETFFDLGHSSTRRYMLNSFVRELAEKWDASLGYFNRDKELPSFKSEIEERFYKNCQFQIKRLRNWSVHGLLPYDLSERDAAYFFIIAMRSWIQLPTEECYEYEELLSLLFDSLTYAEMDSRLHSDIEQYLEQSYFDLKYHYMEIVRSQYDGGDSYVRDNHFLSIVKALGEAPERAEGHQSDLLKRKIKDVSMRLFYQSFWHGLFPLWVKSTYYANLESVGFNIEQIPNNSLIHFLGRMSFRPAFKGEQITPLLSTQTAERLLKPY